MIGDKKQGYIFDSQDQLAEYLDALADWHLSGGRSGPGAAFWYAARLVEDSYFRFDRPLTDRRDLPAGVSCLHEPAFPADD